MEHIDHNSALTSSQALARNATEAARFLRVLGNENRLMILCALNHGERSVSQLLEQVPLSQSALSQHLAILRGEAMVATRRQSQTIHYHLSDPRVRDLIAVLYRQFCEQGQDGGT
jgi:DNA-binding transcriptional ArsR family regulator